MKRKFINILFRVEKLLLSEDVGLISQYYHFMDELVVIRRSTSSSLILNEIGDRISLRSIMPLHEVKTVDIVYREEEAVEAQWMHRIHARQVHYVHMCASIDDFSENMWRLFETTIPKKRSCLDQSIRASSLFVDHGASEKIDHHCQICSSGSF